MIQSAITTIFSNKGQQAFQKAMGSLHTDVGPPTKPSPSPYEE